jgi:predicted acylesterase/phospholipase RssA
MTPDGRIVSAMVLSGGSVYAAYEVGVMKALLRGESAATRHKPLSPDIYVGTSGGAFNAAVMTSQPGREAVATVGFLEHLWVNRMAADPARCRDGAVRVRGDISRYADPRCLASSPVLPLYRLAEDTAHFARFFLTRASNVLSSPSRPAWRRLLEFVDPNLLISTESFVRVVRQSIDLKGIRDSDKRLRIAATNWRTGELHLFENADMTDQVGVAVIQAATAFAGLPPVRIDGDLYVDAGYVLNTPMGPAVAAGGDELHVVFMDPDIKEISVRQFDNSFDVLDNLYQITQANAFKWHISLSRAINAALDFVDQAALDPSQAGGVLEAFGRMIWTKGPLETPLRQVAVHLYHPREDLGGTLGLLNFESRHVTDLIEKGYADAIAHDCTVSQCVVPAGGLERAGKSPFATAPRSSSGTASTKVVTHA